MRHSLYWDDFANRLCETVTCLKAKKLPPVRRVAVFVTNACNFKCAYCNVNQTPKTLSQERFDAAVKAYPDAIIHITGGEPSLVPWLYPYLNRHGSQYRFHLNTNAYITPPYPAVKRLKVSLDSCDKAYWNNLVRRKAFDRVVDNIKEASKHTVTSVTYTLTRDNYLDAPAFADFANIQFPHLYAVFFSVYKGNNPRFYFDTKSANMLFSQVIPELQARLKPESKALLQETLASKQHVAGGVRLLDNDLSEPCYLSMSERVIAPDGTESSCSHLYRDGLYQKDFGKCGQCKYGCNQRLVDFNKECSRLLAI